jgi:hypothetical protein
LPALAIKMLPNPKRCYRMMQKREKYAHKLQLIIRSKQPSPIHIPDEQATTTWKCPLENISLFEQKASASAIGQPEFEEKSEIKD